MNRSEKKRPDFFKRLNANYRVVFIDDESLEEVASMALSKSKIYMLFSTMFVVIVTITLIILFFTPLKFYIPGYGSDQNRLEVIKMKGMVDSLNLLVNNQQKATENLKAVIIGEYDGIKDTNMLEPEKIAAEDMKSILPSVQLIRQQVIRDKSKRSMGK
jgi:hypothetical protein